MHSRIFQISEKPISPDDYTARGDYYDNKWFMGAIADYVDSNTDREEDIDWLCKSLGQSCVFDRDEHGEFMVVVDKGKYFEPKYREFMNTVADINKWTLDDFMGIRCDAMDAIKDCYYGDFDFYIDDPYDWGLAR